MLGNRALKEVSKEIRVASILPSKSQDVTSDILEVTVRHVPLDEQYFSPEYRAWRDSHDPKDRLGWYKARGQLSPLDGDMDRYTWGDFVALSYEWSNPEHQRMIRFDGIDIYVRHNLEVALRAIRNQGILGRGAHLWIDALCINQADNVEKEHEVPRMGDIYSHAADVLIWLGSENLDVRPALDFLSQLSPCWDSTDTTKLKSILPQVLESTPVGIWKLFCDFARLSYWMRTWVLQEICKGTSEMKVLYADKMVKWLDIYHAAAFFNIPPIDDEIGNTVSSILQQYPEHWNEANRVVQPTYPYLLRISNTELLRRKGTEPDLMKLFTFTRHKLAQQPRDKVYGLLGLMAPGIAAKIEPHYESDVSDDAVFAEFARTWIRCQKSLEVLGQCSYSDSPSWVPHLHNKYRHLLGASEPRYNASAQVEAKANFSEDGLTLLCEGLLIDTVQSVTTSFLYAHNENNASLPSSASQQFGTNNLNCAYPNQAAQREALWRTMVGNRNLIGQTAPEGYASMLSPQTLKDPDMENWMSLSSEFHVAGRPLISYFQGEGNRSSQVGWLSIPRWVFRSFSSVWPQAAPTGASDLRAESNPTDNPEAEPSPIFTEAVTRVTRFAWSRRLMTTESGLLGMGPEEARPGDIVAVLFGCSFPVLLRPTGRGTYRLVKPCYVHGLMEGEAIQQYEEGTLKGVEFSIE
ncbi:HET-domain-containing protein [Nemania diffusa]|nr:HET-domain-containing protein [Nemania diffusa]